MDGGTVDDQALAYSPCQWQRSTSPDSRFSQGTYAAGISGTAVKAPVTSSRDASRICPAGIRCFAISMDLSCG